MSFEAINWAFRQDFGAKQSGMKFTLVTLADHADEEHSCFPSVKRLAYLTGQSVRAIRDQIDRLVDLGLVVKESRRGKGGRQGSNRYFLQLHRKVAADGSTSEDDPRVQSLHSGQSADSDRQSAESDRSRVQPLHPNHQEPEIITSAGARARDPGGAAHPPAQDRGGGDSGPVAVGPDVDAAAARKWKGIRERMRRDMGDPAYRSWVAPLVLVSASAEIVIEAPTSFIGRRVRELHEFWIRELVAAAFGSEREIRWTVAGGKSKQQSTG